MDRQLWYAGDPSLRLKNGSAQDDALDELYRDRIVVRTTHFFFPFGFAAAFAAVGTPAGIFVAALAIAVEALAAPSRTGRPRWAISSMARSIGIRTVPACLSM